MMSMAEQCRRMRRLYPDFAVTFDGGWHVRWEGVLRPLACTYRVRLALSLQSEVEGMKVLAFHPHVWVVDPPLQLSTDLAPGERVPHIYFNAHQPQWSEPCLYDPAKNEWTPDLSIAETTIPWTIDWLTSYEGWLATGEWTGGGRAH